MHESAFFRSFGFGQLGNRKMLSRLHVYDRHRLERKRHNTGGGGVADCAMQPSKLCRSNIVI
jgi:hypothetical protein